MLNGSFSAIVGYKFIITARNQAFFEEFVSINMNQRGRIDNEAQNISGRGCYIHLFKFSDWG